MLAVCVVSACRPAGPTLAPVAKGPEVETVRWADVLAAFEALICIQSYPDEAGGRFELPMHGRRDECKQPPPATALERATTTAFTQANEVIMAYPEEGERAQEAVRAHQDPSARLAAVRAAILSDRVLVVLSRRLGPALAAENLRCDDCPVAPMVLQRIVPWAELAPYLAAYIWPDPVVTPKGPDGKPSGAPTYSMHMCVGINGIARMESVDEELRFAALLAAFHTELLFERAPVIFGKTREDPDYVALTDDDARTEYLRTHVGRRVARNEQVRNAICETLGRYASDTPIRVAECEAALQQHPPQY